MALDVADQIWTCSEADAARLAGIASASVYVVPNPVPSTPLSTPFREARTRSAEPIILFVGHMDYAPNAVAADRLVKRIMPLVRRSFPHAKAWIAGRNPSPHVLMLASSPGISVISNPADISPLLETADLALVPLTLGGGTRLKILEAMANGIPVVATPLAAEGLAALPGTHYLAAETDRDLSEAAISVLLNDSLRHRLRTNAHAFVLQHHSPDKIEAAISYALNSKIFASADL